ncbi:unnamed protein product [Paramecium primaurelia]|uniref:Protein kinase domain-containing protein n=1 Tax=Paramecium primaurelia TaxID=5886 RepID=A0A8S1PZ06_PARPR|nr:unnamed protein product [Paramecium primaurelia]
MLQQQLTKLFIKYDESIPQDNILFKTQFFKMSNHKQVTLLLCSDDFIYKISGNNTKVYILKLNYEVRFSVKAEQTSKQIHKQMKGDEFHTQIYKFTLERDDCNSVEFYNFNFQTMYWFDYLRNKLHMLDYQTHYEINKLIGKGSFASVYEAKGKNDQQFYAAKAFYKKQVFQDPKGRDQIENEINVMRKLNHPNLINLHEVFENKAQIYLILDLARGGTLEYALKVMNAPVPFLSAKVIFRQILEGVQYIHDQGIIHRDLKPDNILFRDFIPLKRYGLINVGNNIMISDFGIATPKKQRMAVYQYCGTPGYMAPEVFLTENDNNQTYDEKCDIFSLGCILYYILIGHPLFGQPVKQTNMEMKIDFAQLEKDLNQSHSLTILLQKMLSLNPQDRPSCREILESKIMEVEYGDDGIPVFRDFQRPKSSPPKRMQPLHPDIDRSKRQSVLNPKMIKLMPILEEKQEIRNSGKDRTTIIIKQRNSHFDEERTPAQRVIAARRSSAYIPSSNQNSRK